ncbi:hypothetical protein FDP41_000218 [Naegleria fowleri]|uniref:Splicing factor YJU2 n=1 Tax=Naegleria fowleri TaxID=5763 RepID=A0A6A5CIS0_NAEFO|nr:uncharacterized protein FDP41_000218 [Naegleria fowleri]KAF0985179.1 hypothetical protein FDP41_000218 [Naegleria fowleri]CAG4710037.1 unnamed protein product [Naegleria fowleri]
MAERKVINKYYPPTFDPKLIPRRKIATTNQVKIRMMLPMTIQCTVCGEFMYQGKKFNSRKETVHGEDYLGLKVFRFYIRCTRCASEVTFKTDPKNSDYVAEHNCVRSYPSHARVHEDINAQLHDHGEDAMKKLENKTLDSKQEIEDLDILDSIKTIKQLHNKISADSLLEKLQIEQQFEEEEAKSSAEHEFNEDELREIQEFSRGHKRVQVEDDDDLEDGIPSQQNNTADIQSVSETSSSSSPELSSQSSTTKKRDQIENNGMTSSSSEELTDMSNSKKRDSSFLKDLEVQTVQKKKKKKSKKEDSKSALGALSSY